MENHKLHTIYTAHYRCGRKDRTDITVKGNDLNGRFFAPTWSMVMGVKNGTLSEEAYVKLYIDMLQNLVPVQAWDWFLSEETRTLVCFCPETAFCHRNILANYMKHVMGDRLTLGGWVI